MFQYLTKVIDVKKRFFLVLDEFTHLVKNDRTILTKLQRFWDSFLSRSNIFLVICGSNLVMIQDSVLSYALDWTLILGQDWLMTHADPSIRFSFHSSYTSLGAL